MKKILSPLFLSLFLATSAHALCGNNWSHSTLDICADEAETITGAWNFTGSVTFATVTVNQSVLGNVTATGNLSGANVAATYGVTGATGAFSGALTAATIDTGQGATEVFPMNQNVTDVSTVTFASSTINNLVVTGSLKASDTNVTANFYRVDIASVTTTAGKVGIFTNNPTVALDVAGEVKMAYWDGWNTSTNTWTRLGNSSFTIPGDQTAYFQKGDKIKVTDTTTKYFYCLSVTAGVGVTTFTISGGSDYVLAASPSAAWWSKADNPQGFPHKFHTAAPTFVVADIDNGSGGQPTISSSTFSISGGIVTVFIKGNGTKAGTTNYFGFDPSVVYPAWVDQTFQSNLGSCMAIGATNLPGSLCPWTQTLYYFIMAANINDNQAISAFSATFSYAL